MGLRKWLRQRHPHVRVVLSGGLCDQPPPDWVPSIESDHRRLLEELPTEPSTWAVEALRSCLHAVENGLEIEQVAVVDAWPDGEDAFCVVYLPPFSDGELVGLRRERQDSVRASEERMDAPLTERGVIGVYAGLDDPDSFGNCVANWDMSDPLGAVHELLRFDAAGLGWWGTLHADLPRRAI